MNKYVMIICRNCGNIQCFTEEHYNKHMKNNKHYKNACICGNGRCVNNMKSITDNIKEIFKVNGLTKFKANDEFQYYASRVRKTIDKGFEIVKVESDKD